MPTFTVGAGQTRKDIDRCFGLWRGADEYKLSSERNSDDGSAWVQFVHNGQPKKLTCSKYDEYYENLRALYLTLDGLRLAEGRGILEQYAQFFEALPAPAAGRSEIAKAADVLGVSPFAPVDVAEAAYRALAKTAHPDAGGSNTKMAALNQAINAFREGQR